MIGTKKGWVMGALVSAGLLVGSIIPAEARPRWDRGWDRGWHRHHRGNGFGVGDAIGVAALVGAVAIVASSMSKDRKAPVSRDDRDIDAPPPRTGTDYGADVGQDAPTRDDTDFSDVAARDDAMADACALAARDEAQRKGGYAEVRHMDAPVATASGYNVDGQVETRASYRSTGQTNRFTCAMKPDGRVADVYISRDLVSR